MVNIGAAIITAAIGYGVNRELQKGAQDDVQDGERTASDSEGDMPRDGLDQPQSDVGGLQGELEQLNNRQARNNPPANSVSGFVGTTIEDLSAGATATVTITPTSGHNLDVERLEFTREDDHSYTFELGGTTVSEGHKYVAKPPRTLRNGQKIICVVENNTDQSGVNDRSTTIDFEAQTWGWATEQGRGNR